MSEGVVYFKEKERKKVGESIDFDSLKSVTNIISVIKKYIKLKRNGMNYEGLCPFHSEKTPSFIVYEKAQIYKCFGCGVSGDVLDFVSKIENVSLYESARIVSTGQRFANITPIRNTYIEDNYDVEVSKPKAELSEFPIHYKLGKPDIKYEFRNADGEIMFYTFRFNKTKDRKKAVLPYSYVKRKDIERWEWKAPRKNRVVYNSHLINGNDNTIILVEGEKTADYGNLVLNSTTNTFVTWLGGTNGIKNTDWSILNDRNIIMIPDNDEVGVLCMINILNLIKPKTLRVVSPLNDKDKGWDIADELYWEKEDLKSFIKSGFCEFPETSIDEDGKVFIKDYKQWQRKVRR